ncbi:hypothetical protein PN419_00160 [Halorubrum ezzemoulense]|uniref:hypothetical protein n=1 Tax=Halorubrum ezzemoulense TaxID=337243 RepID=UPI00232A7B52|nr:hypothetical protein [Halorubrum ezzemoulense]MDB9247420.1 hypothetical protein [Halorubrum ezzemoulense]MDB9258671.1 hypothetical protein [Halorubrum ezzemoulense]MDB9264471.1 hypothetical protein [Halorubrum ezzemoulense]MDB9269032.1 hypothetical protein [Halorubrum ezzemoulense]MDB9271439.1 hypothetical protein [Halorubrum ezzemoulense]
MGMLMSMDEDDMPWQVHLLPVIHVEVTGEGALDAQMDAMSEVADALAETDLTVEEVRLEDIHIDSQSVMREMMDGGDDGGELTDMVPDDDSDLPDMDDEEVLTMDDLLNEADDDDDEVDDAA